MPPLALPMLIEPRYLPPSDGRRAGGTNGDGSHRYCLRFVSACCRSAGVKSIRSSTLTKVREYGGGALGIGCVADVFSFGMSDCGTGVSGIGQIGTPVMRSNVYSQPCLVGCAT